MSQQKIISPAQLPEEGLVRVRQLTKLLGVDKATVYRWIEKDILPAPIKIGTTSAWRAGTIRLWLDDHAPVIRHQRRIITN